jgi:ATP-dependent Clp protease ATP-binding subunit ClpC
MSVLALAHKEAKRLGQSYLDTEHLLLGILALDRGVVVYVLKNRGLDIDGLRIQVEEMIVPITAKEVDGADDKTSAFRNVILFAHEEAKKMGHSYTGTEHVLLGLLREEKGIAAQVLKSRGMDVADLRCEVLKELDPGLDARSAALMSPIYLRKIEIEITQMREEISKKVDRAIGLFESLKTEITQLRTDMQKGNS